MWILLEGVDRTGKSSVSEHYRKQGYEVVHLLAPDKKYQDQFHVGPSYLDEMIDLMIKYDGHNVLFDRTWYGELIWPQVYNRKAQLTENDLDILQEYEARNEAQRFLMVDPDSAAHWQRCVDNKEQITLTQFKIANQLYARFAHKFNFVPRNLKEFNEGLIRDKGETDTTVAESELSKSNVQGESGTIGADSTTAVSIKEPTQGKNTIATTSIPVQEKLEKANAINSILSKRIIKTRGDMFDDVEDDIRTFLANRLSELMGTSTPRASLSEDEVQILKVLCKQWQNKLSEKK